MATQSQPEPQAQQPAPAQQQPPRDLLDAVISESEQGRKERVILQRAELDFKQRLARAFAQSGCFDDMKDADKRPLPEAQAVAIAIVKIELGEAMGFSAAESMTGIDIIKGRMAIGANLRATRMQRAGFSWRFRKLDNTGCVLVMYYKGAPLLDENGQAATAEFTEADAKMQGLIDKQGSPYKRDPSSMYFARAITRAQRRYAPGVLGIDVLSSEEAIDMPSANPAGGLPMPQRKSATVIDDSDLPNVIPGGTFVPPKEDPGAKRIAQARQRAVTKPVKEVDELPGPDDQIFTDGRYSYRGQIWRRTVGGWELDEAVGRDAGHSEAKGA